MFKQLLVFVGSVVRDEHLCCTRILRICDLVARSTQINELNGSFSIDKKLSNRRGTARRAVLLNSCYIL